MTVRDLRILIDNLDEYIHVPGGIERLKKTVLHLAVSGQLVPQDPRDGTGEELYRRIYVEKKKTVSEIKEEELPFKIPDSWMWVRLGCISNSNIGLTYKPSDLSTRGVAVLRSSNIQEGRMDYADLVYVKSVVPESKMAHVGDLLICARNGSRRLVGKNAIIDKEGMCFGAFMALLRSDCNMFIKLFLDSPEFRRNLDGVQTTTINQITQGLLNNFVLPLPPLAEQARIVEKVNSIFALIDKLAVKYAAEQAEREKLVASSLKSLSNGNGGTALSYLTDIIHTHADAEQLRKAVLNLAVTGRLAVQDSSEGTGEEFYQEIQTKKRQLIATGKLKKQKDLPVISDNEVLIRIPHTWKWTRFGDILSKVTDGSHNPPRGVSTGLPMLSSRNVTNLGLNFTNIRFLTTEDFEKEDERTRVQSGDILLTIVGSIGRTVVVSKDDQKFTLQRSVSVLTPILSSADFLSSIVISSPYFQEALEHEATGTAQRGVYLNQIKKIMVPLPPLAEQNRIVAKTFQLLDLVNKFEVALETPRVAVLTAEALEQVRQIAAKQGVVVAESNETPELSKQQKKVQRKMLACFVANESLDGSQFGKTKFEKLLHLVEYHVLKRDLNQRYSVQPAGPYDGGFTRLFWDDVTRSKWFRVEGYGNLQKIVAGDNHEKSLKDYGYLSDDEKKKIRDLIEMFSKWGYGEAEIISTLYAVWNNRLIRGEEVSDELLKQDFLQWDSQKTQYSTRLDQALSWMRQNNITPDGWGGEIKRAKQNTKAARDKKV